MADLMPEFAANYDKIVLKPEEFPAALAEAGFVDVEQIHEGSKGVTVC
jgi:hypothetical protein